MKRLFSHLRIANEEESKCQVLVRAPVPSGVSTAFLGGGETVAESRQGFSVANRRLCLERREVKAAWPRASGSEAGRWLSQLTEGSALPSLPQADRHEPPLPRHQQQELVATALHVGQ